MSSTPNRPSGPAKTPLSSGLRERLKRCGRYHGASPSGRSVPSPGPQSLPAHNHGSSPLAPGSSGTLGNAILSPRQLQDANTPGKAEKDKHGEPESPLSVDSALSKFRAGVAAVRECDQMENSPERLPVRGRAAVSTPVCARPRGESLRGKRLSLSLSLSHNSGSGHSPGALLPQQTDSTARGNSQGQASRELETSLSEDRTPELAAEMCTPPECKLPRLSLSQGDCSPSQSFHTPSRPRPDCDSPSPSPSDGRTEMCSSQCGSQSPPRTETEEDVRSQIRSVQRDLSQQREILRKLRMVKMYRSKNNLEELQCLIDKWRQASQQALQDLHASLPEPRPSLALFLQHLTIPPELVDFDTESETFT